MNGVVIATVRDPNGRTVALDVTAWQHILDNHPEMVSHRAAIFRTVAAPDHRAPDPRRGRERFYRRGTGPSRWCFVVVDFAQDPARIVTALGVRRDPEG